MYVESITLLTKEYNEYTVITPKVLDIVKRSGVQNGTVTVLTKHTTTGVTVNEALECLESDIENFLGRLIQKIIRIAMQECFEIMVVQQEIQQDT